MRVVLNGEAVETGALSVAALLAERGFGEKVATALNGAFLPAGARAGAGLSEGDRVEVLAPAQGG